MKIECDWNGKSNFIANINGFKFHMDSQGVFGADGAPAPKQLVLAALCGSTGMEIVSLLRQGNQGLKKIKIEAETDDSDRLSLKYSILGSCDPAKVSEAVLESQERHTPVSSVLSEVLDMNFEVFLNGKRLSKGKSSFIPHFQKEGSAQTLH